MNKKIYILKKDLPDVKAGSEYTPIMGIGYCKGQSCFLSKYVENNSEWFELKHKHSFTIEDMEDCFEQSRLTQPMIGFKYDTFEEYFNDIYPLSDKENK